MKIGKVKPQTVDNFQYDTWVKHDELDLAMPTETIQGPYSGFGSAEFTSGSSTYLSMADHADWDIGGSLVDNWTIDFWIKLKTIVGGTPHAFISQREDGSNEWHIQIYPGTDWGFRITSGASPYVTLEESDTSGFAVGVWYHIAVCKVGSDWGLYKDGVQKAYASQSSTDTFGAALEIGRMGALGRYLNGFMSEMRIINSNPFSASPVVGLTDTITPPTGVHTSDANTHLLLHFNEDYTDSGNTGHTVTPTDTVLNWTETKLLMHGAAVVDASGTGKQITAVGTAAAGHATSKWGGGSLYFDGNSDKFTVPDSADWDIAGTLYDDWTLESWVKHDLYDAQEFYMTQRESAGERWMFYHQNGIGLVFTVANSGGSNIDTARGGIITDTNWHHAMVAKRGTTYGVYLDGVQTAGTIQTIADTFSGVLTIGDNAIGSAYLDGNMEDARIVKGNVYNADPLPSPYAHYKCNDDAASTTVTDDGTGANTGTSSTNTSNLSATGKVNEAFDFNGSSEYINADSLQQDIETDSIGSLSFWVTTDSTGNRYIFSLSDTGGPDTDYFRCRLHSASQKFSVLGASSGGSQFHWRSDTTLATDGTWYHIVVVQDGIALKVYINGSLETGTWDDSTDVGMWFGDMTAANIDNGRIGCSNDSGVGNYAFWDGKIDDFRYYQNVALSPSQVAQIYNAGSGTEGLGDDITIPTATLTGDDPVSSYTFSGLDGNTDETYKIVGTVNHAITGSSNTIIHLNGDTSSNSYYQQFLAYGTTESAGRGTRTGPVIGYTGSVGYYTSTVTLISAKSGKPRLVDAQWLGDATGTTIGYIGKESCVWNNSDDNISSIVVDPDGWIGTGSKITLYKKVSR